MMFFVMSLAVFQVVAAESDDAADTVSQNVWEQRREEWHKQKEKAIEDLHTALALNSSQETAWSTWAATLKPSEKNWKDHEKRREEWQGMTALQKLEKEFEHVKDHEKKIQGRIEATKVFYGVLTSTQKKTFDAGFPIEKRFGWEKGKKD
jgi:LTXXQ motif family protein